MIIQLFISESEPNVVTKSITGVGAIVGELRNDSNVSNPDILISGDMIQSNLLSANYALIPEFNNRYYYIRELKSIRQNLWILSLKCDVLMSFATAIKQSTAIISETSVTGTNNYLDNDVWVSMVKDFTEIINFPDGLPDTGEYILITAGGD